ncbi:hypothetical protein [Streptomyces sp. NPDC086777]|uniref:hypothetical protein n=1 Tax=Streptomyces sp. NPDC086777 TaxID=3154866 RepID=UPI00344F1C3B
MVPAAHTAHDIEATAESLQEDLARLELQKRALERELAAIVAHLDSVQRALKALSVVMGHSADRPDTGETVRAHGSSPVDGPGQQQYGKLTEQILGYFAQVPDAKVRARDVAAALGRDTDSGSINAVRSTLDRLVGTSRIDRAGRGLYRAK